MTAPAFHIPQRPYSPIDALNRRTAALGSPRYAELSAHADYNGHHVTLSWNSYRGYYVAENLWAGRVVIARGDFASCLRAVLDEHARGALGSSATIRPREDDVDAIEACRACAELQPGDGWEELDNGMRGLARSSWWSWRHDCAQAAARDVANPQALTMIFDWSLMQAAESREAYEAAVEAKHGRLYC